MNVIAARKIQLWWLSRYIALTAYFRIMSQVSPYHKAILSLYCRAPFYSSSFIFRNDLTHSIDYDRSISLFQEFLLSSEGSVSVHYLSDLQRRLIFDRYLKIFTNGTDAEYRYIMYDRGVSSAIIEATNLSGDDIRSMVVKRLGIDTGRSKDVDTITAKIKYSLLNTLIKKANIIYRCVKRFLFLRRYRWKMYSLYKEYDIAESNTTFSHLYEKRCQDCSSIFCIVPTVQHRNDRYEYKNGIWYFSSKKCIETISDPIKTMNLDLVGSCDCKRCWNNNKIVCLGGCRVRFTCGHENLIYTTIKRKDDTVYDNDRCSICSNGRAICTDVYLNRRRHRVRLGLYNITKGHINTIFADFNDNYEEY